jgi:hypothetical protein
VLAPQEAVLARARGAGRRRHARAQLSFTGEFVHPNMIYFIFPR